MLTLHIWTSNHQRLRDVDVLDVHGRLERAEERQRHLDNQSIHTGGYYKFAIGQGRFAKLNRVLAEPNTARNVKGFTAAALNENFDVEILVKHHRELVIWPVW